MSVLKGHICSFASRKSNSKRKLANVNSVAFIDLVNLQFSSGLFSSQTSKVVGS